MKRIIIYQIILWLFLLPGFAYAQPTKSLAGIWTGEFYVDSTKKYYPFELSLSESKGGYTGFSRISFEENGIKQVVIRDHSITIQDNLIIIEDEKQLAKASSISQPKELRKRMLLTVSESDSVSTMSGTWSTNKTKRFLMATGSVTMQKKNDFKTTELFKKLDELKLTEALSFNKPINIKPAPVLTPVKDLPIDEPELVLTKRTLAGPTLKEPVRKNTKRSPVFVSFKPKPPSRIIPVLGGVSKAVAVTEKTIVQPVKKIAQPVTAAVSPALTGVVPYVIPSAPAKTSRPVRQPEINQSGAAVDVAKRSISSTQSITFQSDSLQITLYDNGEIDGDTVSVLLDGKVIIAKQGLNTKPNNYTVYFDRNSPDSQMLVMYAENLGSIPPNTGLLIVREGKTVYEVRFSADLKTNAAVILRRKKDD